MEAIQAISNISSDNKIDKAIVYEHQDVSTVILDKLESLDKSVSISEVMLESLTRGEEVETHEMMIALQKAKMELSVVVEVRNKVLEAYQEIVRMQI